MPARVLSLAILLAFGLEGCSSSRDRRPVRRYSCVCGTFGTLCERIGAKLPSLRVFCAVFIIMLLRWAALLLLGSHIAAGLRVQTRAALFASSRDVFVAHATEPPTARLLAATGAAAAAAAALAPSVAIAATTEAELDDYFAEPHPEFFVALVIHWILWGKFDRRIALAYDFGGLVLFAAEPFFR